MLNLIVLSVYDKKQNCYFLGMSVFRNSVKRAISLKLTQSYNNAKAMRVHPTIVIQAI